MNLESRYKMGPDDFMPSSQRRYNERIYQFASDGKRWSRARHQAHWLLHNVVVHPLVGLFPGQLTVKLHDLSSKKLNHGRGRASKLPLIKNRATWLRHNILAHIMIGIDPCEMTFTFHDWTAREMNVSGWV